MVPTLQVEEGGVEAAPRVNDENNNDDDGSGRLSNGDHLYGHPRDFSHELRR